MPDLRVPDAVSVQRSSLDTEAGGVLLADDEVAAARPRIADRYDLAYNLGVGAHGVVWEAHDRLSGETVAIKLFAAQLEARIRREIVVLRLLRLPGVVRLLDEGVDQGVAFIVMERVEGDPFPADGRPWEQIEDATVTLLETLARVHAAGVVHRDLKPANVLVSDAGQVTVLDFGISYFGGPREELAPGDDELLGTPLYFAPEQVRGEEVSPATDLYALGVMLFHALSGEFPHEAESVADLLRQRLRVPAPRLDTSRVPPHVAAVVHQMLEREPDDRPSSAMEVLRALRGEPAAKLDVLAALPPSADGVYSEEALRGLFLGQDRLLHLREDAARALWVRTRGQEARVARELAAWERARLVRRAGSGIFIDRDAIDRLEAGLFVAEPGEEPRLGLFAKVIDLIVTGATGPSIAAAASDLAAELAREGLLGKATIALAEGVHALRWCGDRDAAMLVTLLGRWLEIALVEETPAALDRVLYEICRAPIDDPRIANLEALARAGIAVLTAPPSRAIDLIDAVRPFDDLGLERLRHGLRAAVAQDGGPDWHEMVLADVARWAEPLDDPRTKSSLAFWRGRLAHQKNDFEAAARLYFEAASDAAWTTERVTRMMHGALALMETLQHRRASMWAGAATDLAARCRNPLAEARGEAAVRCAAYRAGLLTEPDLDLVDAVGTLGVPEAEAQICFIEATVAWRSGRRKVALDLAARARRLWSVLGRPWSVLLARALMFASGGAVAPGDLDLMIERAAACPALGVGIQVMGLLGLGLRDRGVGTLRCSFRRRLTAGIPRERWGERVDVLTVNEALDVLTDDVEATGERAYGGAPTSDADSGVRANILPDEAGETTG